MGGGLAALGVLALGIIWWRAGSTPAGQVVEAEHVTVAQVADAEPPRHSPAITLSSATPMPAPALQTMRVALDNAAGGLRRCSELAGGLLFVEFETAAERSEFASVAAGNVPDAVKGCVREATSSIRFQPTAAQVFTEEYKP